MLFLKVFFFSSNKLWTLNDAPKGKCNVMTWCSSCILNDDLPQLKHWLAKYSERWSILVSCNFLKTFWYSFTIFYCAINSSQVEKMISSCWRLNRSSYSDTTRCDQNNFCLNFVLKWTYFDWDLQLRLYQKIKTQNSQLKFHCNFLFEVIITSHI